jgi:hypothetical protein
MSTVTQEPQILSPANPIIKKATLEALKKLNGVNMAAAEEFIRKAELDDPLTLTTTASLACGVIYGRIELQPTSTYNNWAFNHNFWGVGVVGATSGGLMYTAYSDWLSFFQNVAGFHVQGISEGGGVLQVNFFLSNGTPIGQFNGVMVGVGGLEGGNSGTWSQTS